MITKIEKSKNWKTEMVKKKKSKKKLSVYMGIQTKCKLDKMQTDKMQKTDKMQIGLNANVLNIN